MTKLSIIVPCFNCGSTLREAVESIYRQEPVYPYDVNMVDDGSTDATYETMQELAEEHSNIRLIRHRANLGGGAARNTAVRHSDGDLIFCLDADDVLGPGFLEQMTSFWKGRRCDGVGMSTSIKFRGSNIEDVAYVSQFDSPGQPVRFESFLDKARCSLGVVFMMRRGAFDRIGGYPTEHGFDTQGIAFRFLCHGLQAFTCPDSVYYHRVGLPGSYYMREQAAGKLNWNWFNVFDEFLYVFGHQAQQRILRHSLFEGRGKPLESELVTQVTSLGKIYARECRLFIRKGPEWVAREFRSQDDGMKQYWLGNFHRLRGRPGRALQHYARALAGGFAFWVIYYRMLQAELSLSGSSMPTEAALDELVLHSRPLALARRPLAQRLFHEMLAKPQLRQPAIAAKALKDRLRGRRAG